MNFDIFIPIRLDNKRLPGKALKKINDRPVIFYLIERLRYLSNVHNIVVCTTMNKTDDILVQFLEKENIKFFRGSEKDILKRFLGAAKKFSTDFIINVDGDDIYTDPHYIDKIISEYKKTRADYIDMSGFPFGFRTVAFTVNSLEKICELKTVQNTETGYRDFFKNNPLISEHILIYEYKNNFPKNIRLSIDYPEDLKLAKIIFEQLGNHFNLQSLIIFFQKNPELLKITDELEEKWQKWYAQNLSVFSSKKIDKLTSLE
jgi:spore coat polysaccharide biosynthesis protein SpsF